MIKNERQYRITRAQAERFSQALREFEGQRSEPAGVHPLLLKAREDALRSQLGDLEGALREYEALRAGHFEFDQLKTIAELPKMLIRARIARGLSQRDLADRLGLKEQQIQRYEASEYELASFARIRNVVDALGLDIDQSLLAGEEGVSWQALLNRVSAVGLPKEFVRKRLVPRRLWSSRPESAGAEGTAPINATAETIGKIFQWSPKLLLSSGTLELEPALGNARFKVAANANPARVSAYAVYAHYLSLLVVQACSHHPVRPIPTDPDVLRAGIAFNSNSSALAAAVNHVWDLGVPVLPLDDPGSFYGACFREDGRNVIVLKQRSLSESRWTHDLFHELWHAGQEPDLAERTVLEAEEMSPERRESEEEKTASRFAAAVLLQSRGQELADKCLAEAGNDLRRLKAAVQRVATREGVPVDSLANYLAFRLSAEQGADWWGVASGLQPIGNPWEVVRNVFFERADFTNLAEPDRELLAQALAPWEDMAHV